MALPPDHEIWVKRFMAQKWVDSSRVGAFPNGDLRGEQRMEKSLTTGEHSFVELTCRSFRRVSPFLCGAPTSRSALAMTENTLGKRTSLSEAVPLAPMTRRVARAIVEPELHLVLPPTWRASCHGVRTTTSIVVRVDVRVRVSGGSGGLKNTRITERTQ